MINILQVLTR